MDKEDILINTILTLFVGVSVALIREYFNLNPYITILVTLILISIFWLGSFINEINNRSKGNKKEIRQTREEIRNLQKDLNINNRLTLLEVWKEKMNKKKAEINVVDLFKIIIIVVIGLLLLKALGVF